MEKAVATHSSTLAWKIPWTEEPGRLQSMGLWRVTHDWATSLSLFTFMHWRRKWQPTPVFLPGEAQGLGSLVGCRLWGRTESDTTEVTCISPESDMAEATAAAAAAFSIIQQMLAIWFLVPLPFLNPACTSGSSQFTYCWSLAWRILSIILLACEMNAIVG